MRELARKAIDWLWPWCPSGMDHRIKIDVVTNCYGHRYCFHPRCMKANFAEVRADEAGEGR